MDTSLEKELDQLKMSQGMLGQTSQQVAEQIRLLTKCKFLIEKDSSEKEMAVQVRRIHLVTKNISKFQRLMKLQRVSRLLV